MTRLLTWKHSSDVGVRAMDDQHAVIIDTMNELRLALIRSHQKASANELLNKLINYTRMHFQSEELLLNSNGYPGLIQHREEHQRLMAQLEDTVSRLQHGEIVNINEFLTFLHNWFVRHVEGLDKKYGPWLNQNGVH